MNKYVETILEKYEYPIINSIIFANGEMLVLRSYYIGKDHKIEVMCKSTIESYFDYNDKDSVSSFSIPVSIENENYSAFAGEGSWGGDGIVFITDKKSNQPIWFLFLDNGNPFRELQFETSNIILVKSTSGIKLRIPIEKPWEISSI